MDDIRTKILREFTAIRGKFGAQDPLTEVIEFIDVNMDAAREISKAKEFRESMGGNPAYIGDFCGIRVLLTAGLEDTSEPAFRIFLRQDPPHMRPPAAYVSSNDG